MEKFSYKSSGVDTVKSQEMIESLKPDLNKTSPLTLSKIGSFASLFKLPTGYKSPVLVSSTDGVGTKLKLAHMTNNHQGIGQDLVAMCVNDLITSGGKPLFFLDYFATGKLNDKLASLIIKGIDTACRACDCSLIGGETAEMPGLYHGSDYDLAGFAVGVVEEDNILPLTDKITKSMCLIGIESSGFHSNGFSLIRSLIDNEHIKLEDTIDGDCIADLIMKPTTLYTQPVLELCQKKLIKACINITGGGFYENIPRVLPDGIGISINLDSWKAPKIYQTVLDKPFIDQEELLRVFNCGIGFMVICTEDNCEQVTTTCASHNLKAYKIGETISSNSKDLDIKGKLSCK